VCIGIAVRLQRDVLMLQRDGQSGGSATGKWQRPEEGRGRKPRWKAGASQV
jgi:hypothetical protein